MSDNQQISTLKDLGRNTFPAVYLKELSKISGQSKAKELARVFFTYQAFYDGDSAHDNKLRDCSVSSIMNCLVQCAQTGLWPSPATNYVYFIPYGGKAKVTISYTGLLKLMSESEDVKLIYADVVREGETCDTETLKHERSFETLNNPIVGAYAVAILENGERLKCLMGTNDLQKIKGKAKTKKVWDEWDGEMSKKAPLRRLYKMLMPQLKHRNPRLEAAIEIENKDYDLGRTIDNEEKPGSPEQILEILENE